MLQSRDCLRAELPNLSVTPRITGTIYIRGKDPRTVISRMRQGQIVKPIERQWNGMLDAYILDPDS